MDNQTIGDRIKQLRIRADLRQRELAKKLSVTDGTISNWENGRRLPSVTELVRIAHFFDVDLNYFDLDREYVGNTVVPENKPSVNQSIECRKLGYVVSNTEKWFHVLGSILLFTSFIIPVPTAYVLFVFGTLLYLGVITGYVIHSINRTRSPRRTLSISTKTIVHYVHKQASDTLKDMKSKYSAYSLLMVLLHIGGYSALSFSFLKTERTPWILVIVTISFLAIILSYLTYVSISRSNMFDRRVNYYGIKKRMAITPLSIAFHLDLSATLLVAFLYRYESRLLEDSILFHLGMAMIITSSVLSYGLWQFNKKHVNGFTLYSLDPSGTKENLIES